MIDDHRHEAARTVADPQFIDTELFHRPRWSRDCLALAFDVVVVPVLQGSLRDTQPDGGLADVTDANQGRSVFQEAIGGVSTVAQVGGVEEK